MRRLAAALLCVLLSAHPGISGAQSDVPDLGRAEALLRAGKAEEAWQMLSPHEFQHAGRQEFDYLLGMAALESGRENLATFILERVIAVNPGHMAARLEMGRSHFALRDYEQAKREFNTVLDSNPPNAVRIVVLDYLERLQHARPASGVELMGYLELTLGRDTNVNAATSQSSVFVPALGTEFVAAEPQFTRQADSFATVGGGLEVSKASTRHTVFGGANLKQRSHSDFDRFDSRLAELHLGLQTQTGERDSLRFVAIHNEYDLDHASYRRMQSGTLEWTRQLGSRSRLSLFGQGYRIRYLQQDVQSSSSDLLLAGISGAHTLDAATRALAFGSFYVGKDNAVAGRDDGDRGLRGFSLTVQRRILIAVDAFASFSRLDSDYQQQNASFGITRRDRQFDIAVGLSWQMAPGWFLRPQVLRTRNQSNVPLSDYSRTETALTLRRVWD